MWTFKSSIYHFGTGFQHLQKRRNVVTPTKWLNLYSLANMVVMLTIIPIKPVTFTQRCHSDHPYLLYSDIIRSMRSHFTKTISACFTVHSDI